MSMAKEVSAAVFDFKHNESREASEFKSYCVAYMISSRYGVDTRGFNFSRLPKELAEMDTQAFKGELGSMRDVLGEIQSEMYKSRLLCIPDDALAGCAPDPRTLLRDTLPIVERSAARLLDHPDPQLVADIRCKRYYPVSRKGGHTYETDDTAYTDSYVAV